MDAITLPSGATLAITLAPFEDANSLYQQVLEEAKAVKLDPNDEIHNVNLWKDLLCTAFASKKIEAALWQCMKKALYNGERITKDTFGPAEARQDYMVVFFEVAKANIEPFLKSLYAQFSPLVEKLKVDPA